MRGLLQTSKIANTVRKRECGFACGTFTLPFRTERKVAGPSSPGGQDLTNEYPKKMRGTREDTRKSRRCG